MPVPQGTPVRTVGTFTARSPSRGPTDRSPCVRVRGPKDRTIIGAVTPPLKGNPPPSGFPSVCRSRERLAVSEPSEILTLQPDFLTGDAVSSSPLDCWLSRPQNRFVRRRQRHAARAATTIKLKVERLEDRVTPTVLDLSTAAGLTGTLGGINFIGVDTTNFNSSTGSGVITPFVRLQKDGIEQGYNTTAANPTIVDPIATVDDKGGSFSPIVQLSSLPT